MMSSLPAQLKVPTWYQVNEIFTSVQGEGVLTGSPATFIRLQGCTVGCSWCDSGPLADQLEGKRSTNGETRNTWGRGGQRFTIEEIVNQVGSSHVVITGGEPTIWNLDPLMRALRSHDADMFIQLETSGQNELKGTDRPDHVTWSPKANLGYRIPDSLKGLVQEVKWVVDLELPFAVVLEEWSWFNHRRGDEDMPPFVFMPEGCPPTANTILKAMEFAKMQPRDGFYFTGRWRAMDRLQYRFNVR